MIYCLMCHNAFKFRILFDEYVKQRENHHWRILLILLDFKYREIRCKLKKKILSGKKKKNEIYPIIPLSVKILLTRRGFVKKKKYIFFDRLNEFK